MLPEVALFVLILILIYFIYFLSQNGVKDNSPPGPLRIPPFGNLIQMAMKDKTSYIGLDKLAKKYGDVMSIKMGLMDTVVLSSYKAIRDVFTQEETYARQCTGVLWDRNYRKNIGLAFSHGDAWTQVRSLCRHSLREHGTGNRDIMETVIPTEISIKLREMAKESSSNAGKMIHFTSEYFHKSFAKIMSSIVMGKTFESEDPELTQLLQHQEEFIKNGVLAAGILMAFPFLRYIFPETLGYNSQMKGTIGFRSFASRLLSRRRLEPYATDPRCLADEVLAKMNKNDLKEDALFTEENFAVTFSDIMQGGIDITSNVVNFIVLLLATHPAAQEKCFQEIEAILGPRAPSIGDRARMPFTQCVLLEGLRWSRVGVLGVPRKALKNIRYKEYVIKKDTVLIPNFHSVFFDEAFWENPHVFCPERYLAADGTLITERTQRIIPFGAGKRNCVGEVLARDTLFLFVTSLVQKFQFSVPPGAKPNLEPIMGITLYPHPYEARVKDRTGVKADVNKKKRFTLNIIPTNSKSAKLVTPNST